MSNKTRWDNDTIVSLVYFLVRYFLDGSFMLHFLDGSVLLYVISDARSAEVYTRVELYDLILAIPHNFVSKSHYSSLSCSLYTKTVWRICSDFGVMETEDRLKARGTNAVCHSACSIVRDYRCVCMEERKE